MAAVAGRQWIPISGSRRRSCCEAWATMAKPVGNIQNAQVKSTQSAPPLVKTSKGNTPGAQCVAAAQHSNARIKKSNRRSRFGEVLTADDFDEEDFILDALSSDVPVHAIGMEELEAEAVVRSSQRNLRKLGKNSARKKEKISSLNPSENETILSFVQDEVLANKSSVRKPVKIIRPNSALKLRNRGLRMDEFVPRRDWEEQAYEIIQRQKMRDAVQEKLEDGEERLEGVARKGRQPQKGIAQSHRTRRPPKLRGETRVSGQVQDSSDLASSVDSAEPRVESFNKQHQGLKSKEGGATDGMDFIRMAVRLSLDHRWRPLVEYLQTLGLQEGDFARIVDRHRACLQSNLKMVKERVNYLLCLGVKVEDLRKLIVRHPQILEYRVEQAMKPRVLYLKSLGIDESKLGRIITVAPSLLECSVERSVKPRIYFLTKTVGIKPQHISTVVSRSPQILTQSIEESLKPRVEYFLNEVRLSKDALAKMLTKHPQLFHYSVEDGIRPRVEFLRRIGMDDDDISKVLVRLTQILSLSVDNCLQPKYRYLVDELKGNVHTVTSFPAYFSLSRAKNYSTS
ncbi:hypothetical protein R1flu_011907 [Riccia fluitans]|uniref:Mitochondrial transcription termination factor n=1 Tax=Riccia fluitans TaxID=41844 RepID=A0ABD1Z9C3_9MARC